MTVPCRACRPEIVLDDETWTALETQAAARAESVGALLAYAAELYLWGEGFSPRWAEQPVGAEVRSPPLSQG